MITKFEILFITLNNHEHLAAEIEHGGQRLCRITKERGNSDMDIEFLTDFYVQTEQIKMKFSLDTFMEVVSTARDQLRLCP